MATNSIGEPSDVAPLLPVWLALQVLPPPGAFGAAAPPWLSPSERRRFEAICAPGRRAQFVGARHLMRELLAAVHGGDPLRDWTLSAADGVPPCIERAPAGTPAALRLSISHSADRIACAAATCAIGLDLEYSRRRRDVLLLAQAACSTTEQQRLRELPVHRHDPCFHAMWTLKEAWIKLHGQGLCLELLPRLHTQRASLSRGNAWLWQNGPATLALVAQAQVEPRGLEGVSTVGLGVPQVWNVSEVPK